MSHRALKPAVPGAGGIFAKFDFAARIRSTSKALLADEASKVGKDCSRCFFGGVSSQMLAATEPLTHFLDQFFPDLRNFIEAWHQRRDFRGHRRFRRLLGGIEGGSARGHSSGSSTRYGRNVRTSGIDSHVNTLT